MPFTVGTAGHIDHGKTWLVRALTGKDTDRLPEERARGISIDLGYAPLELPAGRRMSLVDVPGHERFVRAMVAGATGIDLFLLVIDAAEGARPQTHEHLAVLRLLGVEHGVVAVTKADSVDDETLELAVEEARELVPGAEVVPVSAKTGAGLDELRAALARVDVPERDEGGPVRLHVDRVFTLRGIGTVATGTLWSGVVAAGDHLLVEPAGRPVRVRSVQVHDAPVEAASAGQRVALNLATVGRLELARGDVIVEPGHFPVSYRLDVRLTEVEDVPPAVTVHTGTRAIPARVARAGPYAQLRLAEPVVAARGDRVVLRTHTTVGGGIVLDPAPPRGLNADRLAVLERGDPREIVAAIVDAPVRGEALQRRGLLAPAELAAGLAGVPAAGDVYFSEAWLERVRSETRSRLRAQAEANPLEPGLPLGELLPPEPWAPAVASLLGVERRGGTVYLPGTAATLGDRAQAAADLKAALAAGDAVRVEDRDLARYLEREGALVRLGDGLALSREAYERGRTTLSTLDPITLAAFRDAMGISRRTAQLLLERFDADGLTRRVGDRRVLRAAARRA
jgi:selenocysteine-specific elongation factor